VTYNVQLNTTRHSRENVHLCPSAMNVIIPELSFSINVYETRSG